jgi:hypothetical protein
MSRKETISINVKKKVWETYCYPNCKYICQCFTCGSKESKRNESLVKIPNAVLNNLKLPNKEFNIVLNGVGEFGHIISEYNGGLAKENNLVIQCKKCNTEQGTRNINLNNNIYEDTIMLSDDIQEDFVMQCNEKKYCTKMIGNRRCKNKINGNASYCHIHSIN